MTAAVQGRDARTGQGRREGQAVAQAGGEGVVAAIARVIDAGDVVRSRVGRRVVTVRQRIKQRIGRAVDVQRPGIIGRPIADIAVRAEGQLQIGLAGPARSAAGGEIGGDAVDR